MNLTPNQAKEFKMNINKMIESLQQQPEYAKMGMIASHLGVVRATSLDGTTVTGIEVQVDKRTVQKIIDETKKMPGIFGVLVETSEGTLNVGDEIMAVAVGGDTREHVFPALIAAVDRIKTEATRKRELS
jgi:molybdopterin synthase catalytic subunit